MPQDRRHPDDGEGRWPPTDGDRDLLTLDDPVDQRVPRVIERVRRAA